MSEAAQKRILYFEDQIENVKTIIEVLKLTYDVTCAGSLKEAKSLLEKVHFDLILLDIRILSSGPDDEDKPDRDWRRRGLYFLQDLRDGQLPGLTPRDVPVLVISAVVNTTDVDDMRKAGESNNSRFGYLAKPVLFQRVEKAVAELLQGPQS
jgi:CheY-like chemotaxis protein